MHEELLRPAFYISKSNAEKLLDLFLSTVIEIKFYFHVLSTIDISISSACTVSFLYIRQYKYGQKDSVQNTDFQACSSAVLTEHAWKSVCYRSSFSLQKNTRC